MSSLIAFGAFVSAAWFVYSRARYLMRYNFATWWRVAFFILVVTGLALGVWLGGYMQYNLSKTVRVVGVPFPVVIFVWEEDRWTDFVPSRLVQYGNLLANAFVISAGIMAPLALA